MTIIEMEQLGEYISKKTKKETIFKTSSYKIDNQDFDGIYLILNDCCIKHIKDKTKNYHQYKTLQGAKNYVDKFYLESQV